MTFENKSTSDIIKAAYWLTCSKSCGCTISLLFYPLIVSHRHSISYWIDSLTLWAIIIASCSTMCIAIAFLTINFHAFFALNMPLDFCVVLNYLDITFLVQASKDSIKQFKVVDLILWHWRWINCSFQILILLWLWYIDVHVNLLWWNLHFNLIRVLFGLHL